jgi:integrase
MNSRPQKPNRPLGFPLYAHKSGYWAKNIRGRTFYFGSWDDPEQAVQKYLADKDYLRHGVTPPSQDGVTITELFDRFLESRLQDISTGELKYRTWNDYRKVCKLISDEFGGMSVKHMTPLDFSKIREFLAKEEGSAVTLGNKIRCARVAFRYLETLEGLVPKWGKAFRLPSARVLRAARAEAGEKFYDPDQINAFLDASSGQLKAMILLGLNCGFGNTDCAQLPWDALDMQGGWHKFGRPKTSVPRRAKLWKETVDALNAVKTPRSGLVFLTKYGNPWIRDTEEDSSRVDAISQQSRKIGLEFYTLRRTFRTIADEVQDVQAVRLIMGHTGDDMDSVYVQRVGDERLQAIANHVHSKVFAKDT